jgi:hypothetical protein
MITVRRQVELETVFLITMAAAVSIFFVYKNNNSSGQFNIVSSIPPVSAPAEAIDPQVTVASQISPDGTKKVIMKATGNTDNATTYDFSTVDENGANEQFIFSKTLSSANNMVIPFNTWSPDNKYFFIQENAAGKKNVLIFDALGVPFAEEVYLNATDLFKQKNTGNNFSEATGWASESLIIINTTKENGEKGFSYWFEVPSKAIIQLSAKF